MSNKRYHQAKKILCKYEGDSKTQDEMELWDVARQMCIADIDEMGVEGYLNQSPSDISMSFMDICVNTMHDQLNEILTMRDAETGLDELGLGNEQERVDLVRVSKALHNNYASGMAVMTNYFSMLEEVKNYLHES